MQSLKIETYDTATMTLKTTVTLPLKVLKLASRLAPKKIIAALKESGIEVDELLALAAQPELEGPLVEIEHHRNQEKIVISRV